MSRQFWPSWRYDPQTRTGAIFNSEDEVPEGWVDNLDTVAETPSSPPKTPKRKPVTKAELATALTAGGIPFDKDASREALHDLLKGKVMEVLAKRNIAFDADADVRDLLAALE